MRNELGSHAWTAAGAGAGVTEPSAPWSRSLSPAFRRGLTSSVGSWGEVEGLLSSPGDRWRNGEHLSSSCFLLRVRRLHQDAPGNLPSHLVGQLAHGWTNCWQTNQVPSPSWGLRCSWGPERCPEPTWGSAGVMEVNNKVHPALPARPHSRCGFHSCLFLKIHCLSPINEVTPGVRNSGLTWM